MSGSNPPSEPRRPLRLWPGATLLLVQWLSLVVVPLVAPENAGLGMLGGVLAGAALLLWWLLFSRAPWIERLGAPALAVAGVLATRPLVHESIATGMMGMMHSFYVVPVLCLALVAWAVAARSLASGPRWAWLVTGVLLACGTLTLIRTDGLSGAGSSDFEWRWTPTAEERLLARAGPVPPPPPPAAPPEAPASGAAERPEPAAAEAAPDATSPLATRQEASPSQGAEWLGFRGVGRDGVVAGTRIDTDWEASPPAELWRRPIGPGWSSFAVRDGRLYTQEQRGEEEIVASYDLHTGEPVWQHRDPVRFWESNAGAGPRATPTLGAGRVYAFGGTGLLNALDAESGARLWSRDVAADTGTRVPMWGFAGSPLLAGDRVVVAAAGTLAAYDRDGGAPLWIRGGGSGYSSPQLVTLAGVPQVVLLDAAGVIGVAPADGALLWEHSWPGDGIVQPALTAQGDVLLGSGSGMGRAVGLRRVAVAYAGSAWTVSERWTSVGLKPYYNDFVVHEGHAYGFDGGILACVDLENGERRWKGGRYGHGQLLLLPDQDLLLVLSERGELALVRADPGGFEERARVPAIEGKTWNHPVLVEDVLLVRNDQEMAAFRVSLTGG